jgi:hypothetical protein
MLLPLVVKRSDTVVSNFSETIGSAKAARGHLRIKRREILWHRSVRRTEHNRRSQAIDCNRTNLC